MKISEYTVVPLKQLPLFLRRLRTSRIRPLLTLIALNPLLPLSATHSTNRPTLSSSILLLLPFALINFHKPLVVVVLVLALVSPLGNPLARSLVVDELLAALLVRQCGAGLAAELANTLLAREQLPLGRRFGRGQGLEPREVGVRGRQAEQDAVLSGRGDVAGCEQLVQEALGAVAGRGLQGAVQLAGSDLQWVRVVNCQVAQVESVGGGLGDGDGTGGMLVSCTS